VKILKGRFNKYFLIMQEQEFEVYDPESREYFKIKCIGNRIVEMKKIKKKDNFEKSTT